MSDAALVIAGQLEAAEAPCITCSFQAEDVVVLHMLREIKPDIPVLFLDTVEAARTDDLQQTVDYGSLVARVKNAVESDPVDLIETLAARLAAVCLEDPRVQEAEVTVHKPDAPIEATFSDVALTITRSRHD